MQTDSSFGHWLKQQRRACDLTQTELAQRVYCAEITIRKIEAGDLRPSRALAALIVEALKNAEREQSDLLRWASVR